jgi:hypothetical protein
MEERMTEAQTNLLEYIGAEETNLHSPYRAGRTPNWVKVKTAHGRHVDEERAKWNE